ncbi:MAG: ABC transporter permease [Anaerolineae bacterium]|jgi:oligopeptide transport system permease protein|nr:ABC transporter permease [Anaerolineae bacterium]MBT3714444.1 ABC transporter permease [Anaerolineae bacterium]MBT4312571.1 ABC transporter permease [Anaerolineae bacterium]MBT4457694.1 ABC transporter permease [Anaerolineae bacterium]MBT4843461.1 ABC transporter permease [Anaerolineae bacterium]
MAVVDLAEETGTITRKERSLGAEAFRRLLKNRVAVLSVIFIIGLILVSIFADSIAPHDYARQDLLENNAVPQWMLFLLPEGAENYARITEVFPLAADHLGRDMLSRTIYGARVSLTVAFVGSAVSMLVGIIYGMVSGYLGGRVDSAMMRTVDFLYAFPFLVVVILLQTYFKAIARQGGGEGIGLVFLNLNKDMGGLLFLFIAIGLINWLGMARIARGQVLSYKKKEFVEAARAVGANDTRILIKHLFPNILGPLIVAETLAIPGYIFTEAFLSFIGLGVDPPTPSWGIMISEAVKGLRSYPNQILVPAVALSLTTLAFNFLGDGLRDAFDPRQKQ